jgi:uncharacterized protein (TIGR02453 family)
MINLSTIEFLAELSQNNNKAWFDINRPRYEIAKNNFREVVLIIFNEISLYDSKILFAPDKIKFFRINRDIRFSKDKTPYKSHFSAYISRGIGGLEGDYYIQVGANNSFIGGGLYMPTKEDLNKIRVFISEQLVEWEHFLENKKFGSTWKFEKTSWDDLKTIPRGFDKLDPAGDYLKIKRFIVSKHLTTDNLTNSNFEAQTIKDFKLLKEFLDYLELAKNYEPKLDYYI